MRNVGLNMERSHPNDLTRRALLGVFCSTALAAAPVCANAFGFLRGAGDVRKIRMYSGRTGERIDASYWIDGKYVRDAMKEINSFMRDFRTNEIKRIDERTIDILAASHRLLDADAPFLLLSGYRSPKTNAMLRLRSKSVARNSLHIKGQAADVRLNGRNVAQVAKAARSCSAGGVGRYSRAGFVHIDCGPVRTWGR